MVDLQQQVERSSGARGIRKAKAALGLARV
jgi:hypothetical protein